MKIVNGLTDDKIPADATSLHMNISARVDNNERLDLRIEPDGIEVYIHKHADTETNTSGGAAITVRIPWKKLAGITKALYEVANKKKIEAASTEAGIKKT